MNKFSSLLKLKAPLIKLGRKLIVAYLANRVVFKIDEKTNKHYWTIEESTGQAIKSKPVNSKKEVELSFEQFCSILISKP